MMLLVGGTLSALTTNQEEFPMFDIPIVRIGVPYLGAAPVEVEKSVCIRIEEAIEGVEGIDRTTTLAQLSNASKSGPSRTDSYWTLFLLPN